MSYQDEIEKRVYAAGSGYFSQLKEGIREYPLSLGTNTGRADFCWSFPKSGRLFIEDEDNNSQRALNNLIKYWRWCDENPQIGPVLLIHILGVENRLNVRNARFLGTKMESALTENPFYYRVVTGFVSQNQHDPKALWLNDLQQTIEEMLPLLNSGNRG